MPRETKRRRKAGSKTGEMEELQKDGTWQDWPSGANAAQRATSGIRPIEEGRSEGKSLEQQLQERQAEIDRLRGERDRAARELTPEEFAKLRWEA